MMEVLIILLKSSMTSRKIMILNLLTSKSIEVKANALNEGIKQASYEYVMCLDADTVIDDDAPFI